LLESPNTLAVFFDFFLSLPRLSEQTSYELERLDQIIEGLAERSSLIHVLEKLKKKERMVPRYKLESGPKYVEDHSS
jgi:hypothetical protein